MRRLALVILVLSLLSAPIFVQKLNIPCVEASPDVYQGDLVLTDNNVTTIEDLSFDINGSIIVEENATLILKNAIINFTQTYNNQHRMTFRNPATGNPRLQAENATISSDYVLSLYFYGNSSANAYQLDSTIGCVRGYDSSQVNISNSTISKSVLGYGSSHINILNSTIGELFSRENSVVNVSYSTINSVRTWGSSLVNISNCEIIWLSLFDSSSIEVSNSTISVRLSIQSSSVNCSITSLKRWLISSWNYQLNCSVVIDPSGYAPNATLENTYINAWIFSFYASSNATISDSTIAYLYIHDFSIVDVLNSRIDGAYAYVSSRVNVSNSTISSLWNYDSSQVSILNSTITYVKSHDSSLVSILNSTIANVWTYNSSQTGILNSTISYLESHSVVTISNSTINEIYTYDTSILTVLKSTISNPGMQTCNSSTASISESTVNYVTTHHSSTVLLSKCTLQHGSLRTYNTSVINLNNSTINNGVMYTYGSSVVNLSNSTVTTSLMQQVLRAYDSSAINLNNSAINMGIALILESSAINFYKSTITMQLTARDSSVVKASSSLIRGLTLAGDSVAWLVNSTYEYCTLLDQSRAYVHWYLDVHVTDSEGTDVPSANVTATYPNATVAESRLTDANGWTRLTLMEKMMNITGNYPVGNYTATAKYETHEEQTVNMSGNKEIIIQLPFIIPEFPSFLILPLFMIVTLLAVIVYKKKMAWCLLRVVST